MNITTLAPPCTCKPPEHECFEAQDIKRWASDALGISPREFQRRLNRWLDHMDAAAERQVPTRGRTA